MQRKASKIGNRALILIFSAVILLSAAVIFAARLYRPQNAEAVLYADGREVRRFRLPAISSRTHSHTAATRCLSSRARCRSARPTAPTGCAS